MSEHNQPELIDDDEDIVAFENAIRTLTTLFVPDFEDDEWIWWPESHNFYDEWETGALAQLAVDTAFEMIDDDFWREVTGEAVVIAQQGLAWLKECEAEEPHLPFHLLLYSLEKGVLGEFEEAASVLASCFDIGSMLSQEEPEQRHGIIATELYGASSDWAIPLAFGLISFRLHLLGSDFRMAIQEWYEQLLIRAKAHYLPDAQGDL